MIQGSDRNYDVKWLLLQKIIDIYTGNIILVIVIGIQISHVLWLK